MKHQRAVIINRLEPAFMRGGACARGYGFAKPCRMRQPFGAQGGETLGDKPGIPAPVGGGEVV